MIFFNFLVIIVLFLYESSYFLCYIVYSLSILLFVISLICLVIIIHLLRVLYKFDDLAIAVVISYRSTTIHVNLFSSIVHRFAILSIIQLNPYIRY